MEEIEILKVKYRKNIQYIIDRNKNFYGFEGNIEWDYYFKENIYEFAVTKNQKLCININAVHRAVETNNTMYIEYFIIHEIRHIYQRLCINLYNTDISNCPSIKHAELWKENYANYINYSKKEEYYYQPVELDAFIFSTAVIQYLYRKKCYVTPPEIYNNDDKFWMAVNALIKHFKEQNL